MPHATNRYAFEWMILEWAWELSRSFTGHAHYPILVVFDADGVVEQVRFGTAREEHDADEWRDMTNAAAAWLYYDPFDGPVYTCLSWEGVARSTMQRLIGRTFEAAHLTADGETIEFPTEWWVMF